MANEFTHGGDGELFVGEDKTLHLTLDPPVDMTGWLIHFVIRKTDAAGDPALLTKVATVIVGGTIAEVTLSDDETNLWADGSEVKAKTEDHYRHSWKRMDPGLETVLGYGDIIFQKSTTR